MPRGRRIGISNALPRLGRGARARWLGAHLEAQNTPREQRSEAALLQYPEQVPSEVCKQIAEIPELAELGTLAR